MMPFKESVTEFLHAHDPEDAKAKADKFLEVLTMVMQRMKQISLSPEFEVVEVLVGILIKENPALGLFNKLHTGPIDSIIGTR